MAFTELATWLDDRLEELRVPGAALGVSVGDQRFTHTYGTVDAASGAVVTLDTAFRVASLTKIFTATAVARLAHAGQVDIGQPVAGYLPGFGVADSRASDTVTLAHLLSHGAGWADALEADPAHNELGYYVDRMKNLPQVAPAGRYLSYSNSGYLLAGHLLASIVGDEYEAAVRSSVLDPLNLANTGFAAEAIGSGLVARGHAVGEDGPVPVEADAPLRADNPSFGLMSSIDDLLNFLAAYKAAAHDPASVYFDMLQPLGSGGSVGPTIVDRVGMGWMLRELGGHRIAMSQGSDAGSCAAMAIAPDDDFAIAALTNSDSALMLVNDLLWKGFAMLLGATEPEPVASVLKPAELVEVTGSFALWDGMTFKVSAGGEAPELETRVGGEPLLDLTGTLTMTDPSRGFLNALGGRVWFDFVRGETGSVDWLRFAGRLAPRSGEADECWTERRLPVPLCN